MWNEPTERQLAKMPRLYETDGVDAENKMIHMHFFIGASDWYMAEYSPDERIFFGYTILNNDTRNAEWGYTSYDELRSIKTPQGIEIDRDLHWKIRPGREVDRIVRAAFGKRRVW